MCLSHRSYSCVCLFKSWLLKLDDDLDIIHNDSDIEIGHNVDTSVQCGSSTLLPITHTEIAINLLCDKYIDDDNDHDH
jgi:hypothetical protein